MYKLPIMCMGECGVFINRCKVMVVYFIFYLLVKPPVCLSTTHWSIFRELRCVPLSSRLYHLTETQFQVIFILCLMFRKVNL